MQPVRGTRDLLGKDYDTYQFITRTAQNIATRYGFEGIATPIFEFKDVFTRPLGEGSDIVSKEMYEIADRGGEALVLRPEGTAGVARAVISGGLTQSLPLKLFYDGPMFRYERPQKGRMRQLHQFGVELMGIESPLADVEVLALAYDFLKELDLHTRTTLEINTLGDDESRTLYRHSLVTYFTGHKDKLSKDSLMRLEKNPLRILDSKDDGDKELLSNAPHLSDYLNQNSKEFFARVCQGLETLEIPFTLNSRLVRGLDYYCHTAFEFTTSELGAQSAVLAGGRYDGLMETLGGPHIPGVGWGAGIDRLMMLLQKPLPQVTTFAMITMDESCDTPSLTWAHHLRESGLNVSTIYGNNFGKKLKKAHKTGANYALILGSDEVAQNLITLKNFTTGEQSTHTFASILSLFSVTKD